MQQLRSCNRQLQIDIDCLTKEIDLFQARGKVQCILSRNSLYNYTNSFPVAENRFIGHNLIVSGLTFYPHSANELLGFYFLFPQPQPQMLHICLRSNFIILYRSNLLQSSGCAVKSIAIKY